MEQRIAVLELVRQTKHFLVYDNKQGLIFLWAKDRDARPKYKVLNIKQRKQDAATWRELQDHNDATFDLVCFFA